MQVLLALAVDEIGLLVKVADIAAAMSVESLLGTDRAYDERVQVIRPHPGQLASAGNLRRLLAGSPLVASHRESDHAVQDSYCLRCAPQVHGAVRDVLAHARRVIDIELGSIVDNPVIVPDGEVMSTGNFHGEPLAFAGDMLAIAVSELASISERRTDRMLDPAFSRDLPAFLAAQPGHQLRLHDRAVHRGLAWSARTRCSRTRRASTPSRPRATRRTTSRWAGPSMRKLREVVANVRAVLAVEVLAASQALDFRAELAAPSAASAAVLARVRRDVADDGRGPQRLRPDRRGRRRCSRSSSRPPRRRSVPSTDGPRRWRGSAAGWRPGWPTSPTTSRRWTPPAGGPSWSPSRAGSPAPGSPTSATHRCRPACVARRTDLGAGRRRWSRAEYVERVGLIRDGHRGGRPLPGQPLPGAVGAAAAGRRPASAWPGCSPRATRRRTPVWSGCPGTTSTW